MRYLVPIVLMAVLIGFLYRGLYRDPTFVPSPLIGKPAPMFVLSRLDDPTETFGSDDLTGKVALVNVFASWCPPCWQEHPYLMELSRLQPIPIYGLNYKDEREDGLEMIERLGDPYDLIGFDQDGSVGIDWGATGAPETFLIDSDGIILHKHASPLTPNIWADEFLPLVEAARTP